MAHGGKREGAGNKEGTIRPKLTNYWSNTDVEDYFNWLKENYKSNPALAKFVGEHLMGKPVQPIGNDGDEPFKIAGVNINVRD